MTDSARHSAKCYVPLRAPRPLVYSLPCFGFCTIDARLLFPFFLSISLLAYRALCPSFSQCIAHTIHCAQQFHNCFRFENSWVIPRMFKCIGANGTKPEKWFVIVRVHFSSYVLPRWLILFRRFFLLPCSVAVSVVGECKYWSESVGGGTKLAYHKKCLFQFDST